MKSLTFLLSISALCAACAVAPSPAPGPAPRPQPVPSPTNTHRDVANFSTVESQILHYVNLERTRAGLDTLKWNPALDKMAKVQSVEMAAERKMAHELPGAPYPTLKDRARYARYDYRRLAENIAYGYPNARVVVDGWMRSPAHRGNILNPGVVETGVGVARSANGALYYAQVFGARLY
jgi:uncharacterized protein YkwD